jgi:hypothetical protein
MGPDDKDDLKRIESIAKFADSIAHDEKSAFWTGIEQNIRAKDSILKDITNYAFVALGGALTILTVAPHLIKSHVMFYFGATGLAAVIGIALFARWRWSSHLDDMLTIVETRYIRVSGAAKAALMDSKYVEKVRKAFEEDPSFPMTPKLLEESTKGSMIIFTISLYLLAISLLVRIRIDI